MPRFQEIADLIKGLLANQSHEFGLGVCKALRFFPVGAVKRLHHHQPPFFVVLQVTKVTLKTSCMVMPFLERTHVGPHVLAMDILDGIWLVVEPTHLKNISQMGNLPQVGVNIKNI